MEEFENLYEKIQELFGISPDKFNILEETINLDLQLEYLELAEKIRSKLNEDEIMNQADKLNVPETKPEDKKKILSALASLDKVQAYRIIEKYMQNPDPLLKEWGILALQESRMLLESKLLDENQLYISTGLGGKGNKLRYFVVISGKNSEQKFSALQKKIIKNEFHSTFKKYQAEIEKINFSEHMASLLTVIPLNVTLKNLFNEAIMECNQYGDFLIPNFIITNVKTLDFKEIKDFLKKQKKADD